MSTNFFMFCSNFNILNFIKAFLHKDSFNQHDETVRKKVVSYIDKLSKLAQ